MLAAAALHGSRMRSRTCGVVVVIVTATRSLTCYSNRIDRLATLCSIHTLYTCTFPNISPGRSTVAKIPASASAFPRALAFGGPHPASLHARLIPPAAWRRRKHPVTSDHHPPQPPQSITIPPTFATPVPTAAPPLLLSPTPRHCTRPFSPRIRTALTARSSRATGSSA